MSCLLLTLLYSSILYTVPQEVTQLMVDVINDSSIEIQWGPPAHSNGILTHYSIEVFNKLTGFNFSSRVNALDAGVFIVSGLSMLQVQTNINNIAT